MTMINDDNHVSVRTGWRMADDLLCPRHHWARLVLSLLHPHLQHTQGSSKVSSAITHHSSDDHPTLRISKAELEYLSFNTASRGEDGLRVPWLAMLRSPAVHVLWFTHLCSAFGFYLLAINLTLFIREALGFRVTDVSVNTLITACFSVKPRTHLSQNHCNYANNNLTIT